MPRRDPWSLFSVVALAAAATVAIAAWVLVDLRGWTYYSTSMGVRGYAPSHRVLKPSGSVAHPMGVIGLAMMIVPVLYALRKQWAPLSRAGSLRAWLEVHIFCGIVGPVLVTFHTAFKFNGLISVAYWSMLAVVVSGFVGRYLFVRMPRTIRGVELSHDEIRSRVEQLTARLAEATPDADLHERLRLIGVEAGVARSRPPGPWAMRRQLRTLRRDLRSAGVPRELTIAIVEAVAERAQLVRRLSSLDRTRRFFSLWHVFHQPLVYVMFAIAVLHVGVAVYFGYSWW